MSETVTSTLHADGMTVVRSQRFESQGQWFTSFEVGPMTIFASVDLLRRIADEATKAAMVAEGWAPPAPATVPPIAPSSATEATSPTASADASGFPF
jgi:hypothetical protein